MVKDDDVIRSISGDLQHVTADRNQLSPDEMLAIVEGGASDQRLELALAGDLPQAISLRLLHDDGLGVVAAVLWTNTFDTADLAQLEARLRAMSRSEDIEVVLLRLGEQPRASTRAKLDVRFNDLQRESIQDALDELRVVGPARARVLGTWRKNSKRERWTFREVLTAAGVEAAG
ncbi:hypothetical protein [Leifsonia sp. 22587]|uniref:hypothetical protein n=1 Tax=Leifsonia sp. 22587 TaxID=3453946 RepID=UPI003F859013